jgi:uncharacterized protein
LDEVKPGVNQFYRSIAPQDFDLSEPEILGPVSVELMIRRDEGELGVSGRVRFQAQLLCAWCGEWFKKEFDETFFLEYLPGPSHQPVVKGLTNEELNQQYYEGDEVDLLPAVRDTLVLALPIAPVCSPKCKGLCPICGQNLNRGSCSCSGSASSWGGVLEKLKGRLR